MQTKMVQVARVNMWSIGVKNWYVFQDTDGVRYQRWSFMMDDTDEVLMLLKVGDVVEVTFDEHIHLNGTPRNMITALSFS